MLYCMELKRTQVLVFNGVIEEYETGVRGATAPRCDLCKTLAENCIIRVKLSRTILAH